MVLLFFFWFNYFKNNSVKSVIISHSVYSMGIVPRIAISKNIRVFNLGMSYCYSLNKKNYLRLSGFEKYPNNFKKIKKLVKKNLISFSKKNLLKKLEGEGSVNEILSNLDVSVFKKTTSKKKNKNQEKSILIALHCFTDAVHAYGNNLFVDHYEWLEFLGKLSKDLQYKWLIKIHPTQYDLNSDKINHFIKKYRKFSLLKKNSTHNDIINNNNIICALTVYGSIGHEYPLFNIPVINASKNNPHKGYSFNLTPKSIKEYKQLIINCEKNKSNNVKKNKEQIFEYYYMRYLSEYFFLDDFHSCLKFLGKNYKTSSVFKLWMEKFNNKIHNKKIIEYNNFIKTKKFRMIANNISKTSEPIKFN